MSSLLHPQVAKDFQDRATAERDNALFANGLTPEVLESKTQELVAGGMKEDDARRFVAANFVPPPREPRADEALLMLQQSRQFQNPKTNPYGFGRRPTAK